MFESINLGRCKDCGGAPRAVNADQLCTACEFVENVTAAYPKAESYQHPSGYTVLDLSRVNLFKK